MAWTHGVYGYRGKHKCRCEVCTEANTQRCYEEQAGRAGRTPPKHNRSGYINYGCRCDTCVEANKAYCRAYREAR